MIDRKTQPQFISEKTIRKLYREISPSQFQHLRRILPQKPFYQQLFKRGQVIWDWDLLQDFLHRCDSIDNQERVAAYLATLEQTEHGGSNE